MPDGQNAFHRSGSGHENNIKWLSADGHQVFTVRPTASGYEIVSDPVNVGTYNFASTDESFYAGLDMDFNDLHWDLDVAPWWVLGNLWSDTSTFEDGTGLLLGSGLPWIGGAITGFLDGLNGQTDRSQHGNGGNDTLIGGGGADYLDGGNGVDTASYRYSDQGVSVGLRPVSLLCDGTSVGDGTDTLHDIEILRFEDRDVWTSSLVDTEQVSTYATAFRAPLGDGSTTPENDGSGYYVAFG